MDNQLIVVDYRYPIIFLLTFPLVMTILVGIFVLLSIPRIINGIPMFSNLRFIFILFIIIYPIVLIYELKNLPVKYYLSNNQIILRYLFPFFKDKIIQVNEINYIYYSRLYGGIYKGYIIVINSKNKIEVIKIATDRIINPLKNFYSSLFFQEIPIERLSELLKNNAI